MLVMDVLRFTFDGFWHFLGVLLLIGALSGGLGRLFAAAAATLRGRRYG